MRKALIMTLIAATAVAIVASACGSDATVTPIPTSKPTATRPAATARPTTQATPTSGTATPRPTGSPAPGTASQWSSPPPMTIDKDKSYTATIKTNYGDIVVRLLPQESPIAVNNFVFLARQGYYDGVKFHRVVKGFVIQSGDPTGTGGGGPGYTIQDEKVTRDYLPGTVAMAKTALPNSAGSQWFVCLADLRTSLAKNYQIFGEVTSGMDVALKIGDVSVTALRPGGEVSSPTVDVHIDTVLIQEG